ncbi:MAG: SH3 domain-containing protein [Polyangiaceae bacterium]|nr:SH3 domain-containing protein [Polyangiaceae bacterium]
MARPTTTKISVPAPGEDAPRLGRVGIIAAVGFGLGVLWPTLAGVKLVPSAPVEAESVSSEPAAEDGEPAAASAEAPTGADPAAAKAAAPSPADSRLSFKPLQITSCRDAEGRRRESCGELDLSPALDDKLKALASCAGTENARGLLSLGLELDFAKKSITDVLKGRSTTLPDAVAQAFVACAKTELAGVSLEGIASELARYTVFYPIEVVPAGQSAAGEAPEPEGASGTATVSWEVAIIRQTPKDGAVVARVLRGTRVTVTGRQNDWYKVKYDAKGSEGWVFKTAIGM